jgi:hypothetical protein
MSDVPTTEQTISKMSKLKLYELALGVRLISRHDDGLIEERNALKPIMSGHDNHGELVAAKRKCSSEISYQAKPIGLVSSSGH